MFWESHYSFHNNRSSLLLPAALLDEVCLSMLTQLQAQYYCNQNETILI